MGNLERSKLGKRVRELRKDEQGITLNEYAGPYIRSIGFAQFFCVSDLSIIQAIQEDIKQNGLAKVYQKESLENRILSTEGTHIPEIDIKSVENRMCEGEGLAHPHTSQQSEPP
jgi:hypothetical protein